MSMNYRKEVDSGNDRKRMVEAFTVALLRENIPIDIISKGPNFNIKHFEMIKNLERGYEIKEEQILDVYGGYSKETTEQIVPDRYSGVSHPVGGELYPMEEKEEVEKFEKRDKYVFDIEKLKKQEIKKIGKEKDKMVSAITKYKIKFPIIDRIIETINEIDEKKENGVALDVIEIFKAHDLNPRDLKKYDKIYKNYKELIDGLGKATIKYENALMGKFDSEELGDLISKKNLLETEIIQRNTKLVNGFIRQKYASLLVETDELFQTCYIAMWEAAKAFDYKKGNKFSTLAYKYMDSAVKHNFKALTGYSWDDYWTPKKIEILLKTSSEILGRTASVDDLVEYGFLAMSEKRAHSYLEIASEYSLSDLVPLEKESYDEYEVDSQYATYFSDDEIDDYENGVIDEIKINGDKEIFRDMLREALDGILNTLTEKEKFVLVLRFGLDNGKARTLDEVGNIVGGLSRERIRQIEAKALRKLRHPSRRRKLEGFLDEELSYDENNMLKR